MPSFRRKGGRGGAIALVLAMAGLSAGVTYAPRAEAQQPVDGFALERFTPSAPGAGWFVMDDLSMHGGLGGAVALSGGYAHDALRVTDGIEHLRVVSDQASFDVAMAVTYDRFRLYLDFTSPLVAKGDGSGGTATVGAYQLSPPLVDLGLRPDVISDPRIGFDARIFGEHDGPFRLGAGAQLYIPAGARADYQSDGTYRAMLRLLVAGDLGRVSYAAHLGVHIRPLDDSPAPGSPQGSELLFGVAAGYRFPVDEAGRTVVVVGPEVYGESAFKSFLGTSSTGLEGLLTGRIEGTGDDGPQAQVKLGAGAGLNPHFGVPEWRFVLAVTLFDHHDRSEQSERSGREK